MGDIQVQSEKCYQQIAKQRKYIAREMMETQTVTSLEQVRIRNEMNQVNQEGPICCYNWSTEKKKTELGKEFFFFPWNTAV